MRLRANAVDSLDPRDRVNKVIRNDEEIVHLPIARGEFGCDDGSAQHA